ncbi:MAG: signal peptidase II [Oscillatoria sp. PMC 1051.18]|nr:signal peptidase II [Oscillatoria sp. PMC 1050.18]MEC5032195.1 signal peptidase II [Oscillatoria sp. PMC 1051.18]
MTKNRFFWIVALVGLFLDQLTKQIVLDSFQEIGDTVPLWDGVFHLTYVTNTGAAFSLFTNGVHWLRWLSFLVSIGLMALAWFGPRLKISEQLACGFIFAGAAGNGICRFVYGHVIDFLDFRLINFPVFNLADILINIGIIFLLIATFRDTPNRNNRRES